MGELELLGEHGGGLPSLDHLLCYLRIWLAGVSAVCVPYRAGCQP